MQQPPKIHRKVIKNALRDTPKQQKSKKAQNNCAKICTIQKIVITLQRKRKKHGAIAQLVEQRTENPCVPGSIPGGTTENL